VNFKQKKMKKIITIVLFGLFTLNAAAQEAKPVAKKKLQKNPPSLQKLQMTKQ
jgi:hypothetical protein